MYVAFNKFDDYKRGNGRKRSRKLPTRAEIPLIIELEFSSSKWRKNMPKTISGRGIPSWKLGKVKPLRVLNTFIWVILQEY